MHDYRNLRLEPREWSLVIIHPGPAMFPRVEDLQVVEKDHKWLEEVNYADHKNKVYYAFVRCHGDYTDLSVHDLHGFLTHVGGKQAEQLDALSKEWPGFHFYDRGDIGEALRMIYFDTQPQPKPKGLEELLKRVRSSERDHLFA